MSVGQELNADAFAEHWDGPPPLSKLTVRLVTDANARVLALRSGDIDLVYGVPPQGAKSLAGGDFNVLNKARAARLAAFDMEAFFEDG